MSRGECLLSPHLRSLVAAARAPRSCLDGCDGPVRCGCGVFVVGRESWLELRGLSTLLSCGRGPQRGMAGPRHRLSAVWSSRGRPHPDRSRLSLGLGNRNRHDLADEGAGRPRGLPHRKGTLRRDTPSTRSDRVGRACDGDHHRSPLVCSPRGTRARPCGDIVRSSRRVQPGTARSRQRAHRYGRTHPFRQWNPCRAPRQRQGICGHARRGCRCSLRGFRGGIECRWQPPANQRSARRSTFPVTLTGSSSTNCTFVGHL